jgi:hypothetical protein
MTRRTLITSAVAAGLIGLAGFAAFATAAASGRPDCPGKIVCPQTGERICRDKCPTVDPNRPDCPGRITCPQTGELICVDKCPLGAKTKTEAKSCCGACCKKKS